MYNILEAKTAGQISVEDQNNQIPILYTYTIFIHVLESIPIWNSFQRFLGSVDTFLYPIKSETPFWNGF